MKPIGFEEDGFSDENWTGGCPFGILKPGVLT
jgi:hypothetical protein